MMKPCRGIRSVAIFIKDALENLKEMNFSDFVFTSWNKTFMTSSWLFLIKWMRQHLSIVSIIRFIPGLELANQIAHVTFATLPVLWGMGLLSHMEPLALWACEQLLIHAFSGSAMASGLRWVFVEHEVKLDPLELKSAYFRLLKLSP